MSTLGALHSSYWSQRFEHIRFTAPGTRGFPEVVVARTQQLGQAATSPTLTRRERQRQATLDEIVTIARSLLRSGRAVTLRAVAADMGFAAPALYRYVDSAAALTELVAKAIFNDVVDEMARVCDQYAEDDPAAQIVAAATAFRDWALDNKAAFQLAFATNPPPDGQADGGTETTQVHPLAGGAVGRSSAEMFADFFARMFVRLWQQRTLPVPRRAELPEVFVSIYEGVADRMHDVEGISGENALGLLWFFELAWAKVYGTVALEVFGHIDPRLIASAALFEAQLLEIGQGAGLVDEWDRLAAVADEVRANRADHGSTQERSSRPGDRVP
jgi:AcrR family transcriptional regulator